VLDYRRDKRREWNPALYRFTPAVQLDVKGTYVSKRSIKEGVGAPLVAVGLDTNLDARKNFAIPRTYYGVTAVDNFSGRRCTLSFEDPLATETTILQGRTFPLAPTRISKPSPRCAASCASMLITNLSVKAP
jgi:hypothetical protein